MSLLPYIGYTVIALLFTYPTILDLQGSLLVVNWDAWGCIWAGWWLEKAFKDGLDPFFSPIIGHPYGNPLYALDSWIFILLFQPLRVLFGQTAGYNIFCIASLITTASIHYHLVKRFLGVKSSIAFISGVIWTFNGVTMTFVLEGQAYLLLLAPLSLFFFYFIKMMDDGERRDAIKSSIFYSISAYSTGYFAVLACMGGLLHSILLFVSKGRRFFDKKRLSSAGIFLILTLILLLPLIFLHLKYQEFQKMGVPGSDSSLAIRFMDEVIRLGSVSLADLFSATRPEGHIKISNYGGMAILFAGIASLFTRNRKKTLIFVLPGFFFLLLSFGPKLIVFDTWRGDTSITMPYYLISKIPIISSFRFPLRFLVWYFLSFSLAVPLFIEGIFMEKWRGAVVYVVSLIFIFDSLVMTGYFLKPKTRTGDIPQIYEEIGKEKGDFAILDLFPFSFDIACTIRRNLSRYYQTGHGKRSMAQTIDGMIDYQWVITSLIEKAVELDSKGEKIAVDEIEGAIVEAMKELDVRYVVLHTFLYSGEKEEEEKFRGMVQRFFGSPRAVSSEWEGRAYLYLVQGVEGKEDFDPKRSFRTDSLERIKKLEESYLK